MICSHLFCMCLTVFLSIVSAVKIVLLLVSNTNSHIIIITELKIKYYY